MTAHLLDTKTHTSQHVILAGSQFRGYHTSDVLAQVMVDTHYIFHLQDKVTKTPTDNGKQFLGAFMQFGREVEILPDIPETSADPNVEGVADVDLDEDPEAGDVDEVEYITIEAVLDESSCQCT
ncbi:Hypothetical predicted protein [Octopus vulgaris]|uniref:Uncharacterized protein n=1 Tax=Octopus vulgaris TaxID=6645 RepID=A0AA36AF58_OCTVU|nr:Hypothetical predicted protein [Octopus vulgaris]